MLVLGYLGGQSPSLSEAITFPLVFIPTPYFLLVIESIDL